MISIYLLFYFFYYFRNQPGRTANTPGVFKCVGSFIATTKRRRELKYTELASTEKGKSTYSHKPCKQIRQIDFRGVYKPYK